MKNKINNITKLFFSPKLGCELFEWGVVKDLCCFDGAGIPSKVAINYGSRVHGISTLGKKRLEYSDLESLIFLDISDEIVLSFSKNFIKSTRENAIFECVIVANGQENFGRASQIISCFSKYFELHYAYSRMLSDAFDPTTETKIKRSLFGGTTVQVPRREDEWLMCFDEIRNGSIKGIYPINYWGEKSIDLLEALNLKLPTLIKNDGNPYHFNEAEQKFIIDNNINFKKFLRF